MSAEQLRIAVQRYEAVAGRAAAAALLTGLTRLMHAAEDRAQADQLIRRLSPDDRQDRVIEPVGNVSE